MAVVLGLAAPTVAGAAPASGEQPAASAEGPTILVMLRLPPEHYRPQSSYSGGYGDAPSRNARQRLAKRIARDHQLALVDDWPMPLIGIDCFVMRVPAGTTPEAAALDVSRDPRVEWSQPMQQFEGQSAVARYNDPLLPAEPAVRLWRLPELHQLATGRGIVIAVIDSRIDRAHPDLAGQLSDEKDFVGKGMGTAEQHGTQVAGIIAARANNRAGIVGIAPAAHLMGLRACWQDKGRTLCDSLSLAKALHYAIDHRAQVINLSLAGPQDRLLAMLMQTGLQRGRTIVAAYDDKLPGGGFPASLPGVIAVSDSSALSRTGLYSAPGRDVPTTQPGDGWNLVSGSSFAAAHVSGLFALLREREPGGKALHLATSSSTKGEIDACRTLVAGMRQCDCACSSIRTTTSIRP